MAEAVSREVGARVRVVVVLEVGVWTRAVGAVAVEAEAGVRTNAVVVAIVGSG